MTTDHERNWHYNTLKKLMPSTKISILHFSPVEKYPPAMNAAIYLSGKSDISVRLYSTRNRGGLDWFKQTNIDVARNGRQADSAFLRYLCYLKFNVITFLSLLLFRPHTILYYETYSVFPAYLYWLIHPGVRIYIHYHEYSTPEEYSRATNYMKLLRKLETRLYRYAEWVSHTNPDRLGLFQTDHADVSFLRLCALPNYPPRAWYSHQLTDPHRDYTLKIVYVGALSLETMHTRAFASWVIQQEGRVSWDIYSGNLDKEVVTYLDSLSTTHIHLKGEVNYYQLPEVLRNYNVGVILYNGHIPNFVYNIPNKVLEYYALGLEIWCSGDLISVAEFAEHQNIHTIRMLDFTRLNDYHLYKGELKEVEDQQCFCYENEYEKLYKALLLR